MRRLRGIARLGHPYPSVLDGLVTAALAVLAGGSPGRAALLGIAMVAIQVSIGATNDLADAPIDAIAKPGKPIPAGEGTAGDARVLAVGGLLLGLGVSAGLGPAVLVVGAAGAACGYLYDLRLKSTPFGPLAFAIGIPLLPAYAWLGASGMVPGALAALLPAAGLAGVAIAIANGASDVGPDRRAGTDSLAIRLGGRAWAVTACAWAGAIVMIGASIVAFDGRGPGIALAVGGSLAIVGGLVGSLSIGGRRRGPFGTRPTLAWEVQAAGAGILAAGWAWALRATGAL